MVGTKIGWGETMILATRTSSSSEEILTHHYHHLHHDGYANKDDYVTSRRFNACDKVLRGDEIAREGTSGTKAVHLHHTIRRWKNLKELNVALKNNGGGVYGYGYSFGDDSRLKGFLDPLGILYNSYRDYENPGAWYLWSQPYALEMRRQGIEFGLFTGKFGAEQNVTRREAARWIKIAAGLQDAIPQSETFCDDLPLADSDAVYVETLTGFPEKLPAINPNHSCETGKRKFCPDAEVNRVEALKMIVLSFYENEFLVFYDNLIWRGAYYAALGLLSQFNDVDPLAWYAPYVIIGLQQGIVEVKDFFYPEKTISRAEFSKWLIQSSRHKKGLIGSYCDVTVCGTQSYCDNQSRACKPISQCLPTETQQCEVGGGYVPAAVQQPTTSTVPTATTPVTIPAPTPSLIPTLTTAPAAITAAPTATVTAPPPPAATTATATPQLAQAAPPPQTATAVITFTASSPQACDTNNGTATLCLEVNQNSGSQWRYRICKQNGNFINAFTYQLTDQNNYVFFGTYPGSSGVSCTPWQNFDLGYITNCGTTNGAGLMAKIISPSGCSEFSCQFRTGEITIRKNCL
jgi:hypothetical protein